MKNYRTSFLDGSGIEIFGKNEETDDFFVATRFWMVGSKLHRIDGPAVEFKKEWYVNNIKLDKSQIKKLQEMRKIFNDDDLLNELLLSGQIIL